MSSNHGDSDYVGLDDFLRTDPVREPLSPVPASGARSDAEERPIASTRGRRRPGIEEPTDHREPAASSPVAETADSLTAERLLPRSRREPEAGWRRLVYKLTFGLVNVGDSKDAEERHDLEARAAARLTGSMRSVVVISRKGGVGKSTTAMLIGKIAAELRHDRVVLVDANPDAGTAVLRTVRQTPATVWDAADAHSKTTSFSDMSRLVSRDATRLDVLASESDPERARAFGAAEYGKVHHLTSQYYAVSITDTGTDFTHEVMHEVLRRADCVVVVAGTRVDEARLASEAIDMVASFGYPELARSAVVAMVQTNGSNINVGEVQRHFDTKAGVVVPVPQDPHLAEGSNIELPRLKRSTRRAGERLAAEVVDRINDNQPPIR